MLVKVIKNNGEMLCFIVKTSIKLKITVASNITAD